MNADQQDAPIQVPEQCGRTWGWHREHYCIEPAGHDEDTDAVQVHYCECDVEADEHRIRDQEAEDEMAADAWAEQNHLTDEQVRDDARAWAPEDQARGDLGVSHEVPD